jgi:hypothetical protein
MSSLSTCHHCKASLTAAAPTETIRIGFRDCCDRCGSDLHVCLNCHFYDDGAHHECRETSAEWVRNKERSNVCEYFRPLSSAASDLSSEKAKAIDALDDLFKK